MRPRVGGFWLSTILVLTFLADDRSAAVVRKESRATNPPASARGAKASTTCLPCEKAGKANKRPTAKSKKVASPLPCHPKDYLDPKVAKNFRTAVREMKRAGITPHVTSAWRSSDEQDQLHKCSLDGRCRARRGVFGAMPSGQSLHEAGLAVDIAGIAEGSRGHRYLTPRGRRIVRIMEKNGFNWRYGMSDPVHFEADPRRVGYRSVAQAIKHTQATCQVKLASARKQGRAKSEQTNHPRHASSPPRQPVQTRRLTASATRGHGAIVPTRAGAH